MRGAIVERVNLKPLRAAIAPVLIAYGLTGLSALGAVPSSDPPGVKPFAAGVAIDWRLRTVEVAGRIVLREGPLELFACSPRTREHESIIVIEARPLHLFQAMGLIGLKPGSPVRFDEKRDRWFAARGEALRLRVRYRLGEMDYTVPVERWLSLKGTGRSPDSLPWVFAGSVTGRDGRLGADLDGTVVTVVDFETALIALGATHSADNELLWLGARTSVIPPVGTACTMVISARVSRSAGNEDEDENGSEDDIRVLVSASGLLKHRGKDVTSQGILTLWRAGKNPPDVRAVVLVPKTVRSLEAVKRLLASLIRAGVPGGLIEVRPAIEKPATPAPKDQEIPG